MLTIGVLRHATTAWNTAGRMQGRRDIPLSAAGRAEVAQWRVPAAFAATTRWISSPLARAVETARALGGREPSIEPALTEMDWGAWEGRTLAELRARHGAAFAALEARGLDFLPPAGESPRDVLARVQRWAARFAPQAQPAIVVTHKGVLRAFLVAATGWDMIGKPPVKLRAGCMHAFTLAPDGALAIAQCNIALGPFPAAGGQEDAMGRGSSSVATPRRHGA